MISPPPASAVLLLDKRAFPRPKACACGLTRKTLAALRYSVEPVIERVCREIVLQQRSSDPAHGEVRVKTRNVICAMAVRERFDDFCLQQTLAAGRNGGSVEFRKINGIAALREDRMHIELDLAVAEEGERPGETVEAPVLIGADGSNGQTRRFSAALRDSPDSWVSKEVHAKQLVSEPDWYARGFALEATIPYTALPGKLPAGDGPYDLVFDFAPLTGGYGWLFPKGDHINIGVGSFAPSDNSSDIHLKRVTRQLLAGYSAHKLGISQVTEITGQHLGMGGQGYLPQGRVLLAGDAAGLVDPLTGEGIHSAIISGQAAAAAVNECPEAPAEGYVRRLAALQETLAFSHRAARAFYAAPERGFRIMRNSILRNLVLKTYADGLPHTRLLARLAKIVA